MTRYISLQDLFTLDHRYLLVERWSTVASATLILYEYLLTFNMEVRLVWRRKFTAATVLFLLNRYIFIVRYFMTVAVAHSRTRSSIWRIINVLVVLGYVIWAVFSTLRVYVFSRSRIWLPAIVLFTSLVPVALETYLFTGTPPIFQPGLSPCTESDYLSPLLNTVLAWVNRVVMMSGDVLVIVIIWTKTSSARKAAQEAAFKRSFAALLLRSGVLHFVILSLLNVAHLACWLTNVFPSFMGTIGEALTSIVVSRYILNLREFNRSGVTSNMTCCSRMSVSIQFVLSHDTDSNSRPSYENNLSQRFMNFVEPLSAPVEGFLAEGLLKGDEEDNVQYILDVAEVWNDALEKSEDELLEV